MTKLFIITGGPGSGKTTLINALVQRGFYCYPEIARAVIKEQLALGTDHVPWLNLEVFSRLVLQQMLVYAADARDKQGICFTDRGIPDIIAYLNNGKLPVAIAYEQALLEMPYQKKVFMLPPWPEIYANDDERRESPAQAANIYNALKESYTGCGFDLVEVPRLSLEDRIDLVLQHVLG